MAELASGAVSSLLGVIRNEGRLLSGVQGDVQFIKEEMESMNSFLLHLARTAPPGSDHDEQVRTWMNQVRLLAQDCNNCIDLYLYRGNPEIHLPKGRAQRYLSWTPWFLRKLAAQHRAAVQLRELKDRARDVGKRRLRYGVEVPGKAASASAAITPHLGAATGDGGDHHQDGDDLLAAAEGDHRARRRWRALAEPRTLDDYLERALSKWMRDKAGPVPSVSIVAPDTKETSAIARNARAVAATAQPKLQVLLVDIPAVHFEPHYRLWFLRGGGVKSTDILYYILRELEQPDAKAGQEGEGEEADRKRKKNIDSEKLKLIAEIRGTVGDMKVDHKIDMIIRRIGQMEEDEQLQLAVQEQMKANQPQGRSSIEPLGVILLALRQLKLNSASNDGAAADQGKKEEKDRPHLVPNDATANDQDKRREKTLGTLAMYDISKTAKKLKKYMEMAQEVKEDGERQGVERPPPIVLQDSQYERIIHQVFPTSKSQLQAAQDQGTVQATRNSTASNTLGEDQIKEIVHRVLEELQRGNYMTKLETSSSDNLGHDQIKHATAVKETIDAILEETKKKVYTMLYKIKEQMIINGIVDKIRNHLKDGRTLMILKIDKKDIPWEGTRNALSMLHNVDGAVIVTTRRIKTYCYPSLQEPIHYSLVGLYHDIVLELTAQQKNEDGNYNPHTLRSILEECNPHEFCMKIFAHALYANPKRSNEELSKLQCTLQAVSPKSLGTLAPIMIKFSYNDLPKEFKSCLLYLAIFTQGCKIKRSTLIARWVVEGLITTEDWSWSSSVCKAEKCFDALINRCLVYPADIGAAGEAKNYMVDNLVHDFISKIAKKQHIVETRLSHHLARHFSIFNDLRLRGSDTINKFLQKLSVSSHFPLLKVLDLEGCCFAEKNRRYLKDICCKVVLLKYLSLRGTDVTQLPDDINNLHELEVLDIRQTRVSSTRHVRLLKLKRLLAGHKDPCPRSTETGVTVTTVSTERVHNCVLIPEKIENMIDMEVLSSVKPQNHQDLKDIGALCQLRKLGVVIKDKDTHLYYLLEAISNLHESLRSLSITLLPITGSKGTTSSRCFFLHNATRKGLQSCNIGSSLKHWPEALETLSISGISTQEVQLLQRILAQGGKELSKVTLSSTSLNQCDLEALGKLPKLCCVRLQDISCTESKLTFNKDQFNSLKYFIFEGSKETDISFQAGAIPNLEEIVLSFTINALTDREEQESKDNTTTNAPSIATITGVDASSNPKELDFNTTTSGVRGSTKLEPQLNNNTIRVNGAPKLKEHELINTTNTTSATNIDTTTAVATATNTIFTATNANTMETNTTPAATKINNSTTAATNINTATNPPAASADTNTNLATTMNTANPTTMTTTKDNEMLHSLFKNAKQIVKVTLHGTMLKQDDLKILANKPSLRCLVLLDRSYAESELTLEKDEFPKLNLLIVNCSNVTNINFNGESSPKLEKIVWNFTNMESLSGIDNLPRLKELELNSDIICKDFKEAIKKHETLSYKL